MFNSRLVNQDKVFVKFDQAGKTQLVKNSDIVPGFNYRRVHYTHQDQKLSQNMFTKDQGFFFDKNFVINASDLDNIGNSSGKVVLRRLYDLYRMCPKSIKPQFFPPPGYIPARKISADPSFPPIATQIGLFPTEFYKSFFLTQDFSKEGFYQMIINQKGRFQTGVVDDWVPVYEHSLEPIWGMDLDQAWQIIILKFWAKRNGGYARVKNIPPFFFIQGFTNSNWKYFNLQRQGYRFLAKYADKIPRGRFILKTKNTNMVQKAGLVPNSAGYELIDLVQTTVKPTTQQPLQQQQQTQISSLARDSNINNENRKWVLTLRSTLINRWSGNFSILDKQVNNRFINQKQKLALDRDFMINDADFLNLFSNAYVASRRQSQPQYFSDYYLIRVQPNNKKSIYLKFFIQKNGWLDFSIKQLDENRVQPITAQSRLNTELGKSNLHDDGKRYLKVRFILMKQNSPDSPTLFDDPKYLPPKYDTYQIEYFHGYNRGDAKFLNVVKGHYILKIKPQGVNKVSQFVFNYASNSMLNIQQYFPDKKQTSLILRQAMSSLIGVMALQYPEVDRKFEEIVYANTFENIGYGFVGVRANRSCPYSIMIQVDPTQVRNSGYKLKNQFKRLTQPFSVIIRPGQSTSVVLKKIPGVTYIWPPKGIQIFRQKK